MSIKIAICDDAAEDIELLAKALYAYDHTFEIITYTNSEAFIADFLDSNPSFDILFMDIYMPGMDGITTAQKIRNEKQDIKIIFVSSSKDHYSQAYEVFAFNYILKPLDRERLHKVLDRAIGEIRKEFSYKIRFNYKSTVYCVDYRNILYMESQNKLILFHLAEGNILRCYGKLDEFIKELQEQIFIRCHQSFIVNTSHITEMGENYFRVGQTVIAISKKYLKPAKDLYYAYLFSRMGGGKA